MRWRKNGSAVARSAAPPTSLGIGPGIEHVDLSGAAAPMALLGRADPETGCDHLLLARQDRDPIAEVPERGGAETDREQQHHQKATPEPPATPPPVIRSTPDGKPCSRF